MYTDRKRKRWPGVVFAVFAVIVAAILLSWAGRTSGQDMGEESAAALKAAVERSALQCYVVEGNYPPSLAYLEENYGLQINREDFYVDYDIFASNVPPDIRVVSIKGEK